MEDPIEMGEDALDISYPGPSEKMESRVDQVAPLGHSLNEWREMKRKEEMNPSTNYIEDKIADETPRGYSADEWTKKNEEKIKAQESRRVADVSPQCYSREEVMRIRKEENLSDSAFAEFDHSAFANVEHSFDDGVYSRESMLRLRELPEYAWSGNLKDWILNWTARHPRTGNEVLSSEYWIWHNVNDKKSFARKFGHFPFHLPHFDAVGFEEASSAASPVLRYLHSHLFQSHLKAREQYEGAPSGNEEEIKNYERIVAGCDLREEWPIDGYSRDEMMALETKRKPDKDVCLFFDSRPFHSVRCENTENRYNNGYIRILGGFPGYNWNMNPVEDSLSIMNRFFPGVQRKKKMLSAEYWVWHNVNAQNSFAVYFGFFPFYLPYFDAAAFISAARPESIVPAYLSSQLYQEHLKLRETYEDAEYNKEWEERGRRRLVREQRQIMRFPLTDEQSVVHFEDPEGKLQNCSVDQAHAWLRDGYFTSEMRFLVTPKDVDPKEWSREREWAVCTLADLIERNGRQMPFVFSSECGADERREANETEESRNELSLVAEKRTRAKRELEQILKRRVTAQEYLQRIAKKYPATTTRFTQTRSEMFLEAKVESYASSHPQFVPKPGVDPLRLLRAIPKESMERKIVGEAAIADRLEQLRKRYDRCDKKALVFRTVAMINKKKPANCRLCELKMESTSTFIEHVTCKKHANKLPAVCAEALEFWFNVIEEVSKDLSKPSIPPLALVSYCTDLPNPHPDLPQAAATMLRKLKVCDKKVLDGEAELKALFNTQISCSVCARRVYIDKPANLIAHFATQAHIAAATRNGGQMHAEVIDYWMRALDRAMVS